MDFNSRIATDYNILFNFLSYLFFLLTHPRRIKLYANHVTRNSIARHINRIHKSTLQFVSKSSTHQMCEGLANSAPPHPVMLHNRNLSALPNLRKLNYKLYITAGCDVINRNNLVLAYRLLIRRTTSEVGLAAFADAQEYWLAAVVC